MDEEVKKLNERRYRLYEVVRQTLTQYSEIPNEIFDKRKDTRLEASIEWIYWHNQKPEEVKKAIYIALGPIKNYEQIKKASVEYYKYLNHKNVKQLFEELGFTIKQLYGCLKGPKNKKEIN